MSEKEYYPGMDWLRIFAAFGIVGCHLDLSQMTTGALWLKRFTDLNVGVFAVIAGFFAVPTAIGLSWFSCLRHRFTRLIRPYALWSVLYIILDIVFDTLSGKALSFQPTHVSWWLSAVFLGNGAAHLWFLISLFYVQTLTHPFLRRSPSHPSVAISITLGLLGLGIVWLCPAIGGWFGHYCLRLAGFFLVGVAFYREKRWLSSIPIACYGFLLMVGLFLKAFGWHYAYIGELVVILPAVALALVWKPNVIFFVTLGKRLGGLSFGVYLTHVFFTIGIRQIILMLDIVPQTFLVYLLDWIISFALALTTSIALQWGSKRFRCLTWLKL